MTALSARVLGVGVWGPGLEGWAAARAVLRGDVSWAPRDVPPPAPAILPATERRRAGPVVRLALTVAQEAADQAAAATGLDPGGLRSVFGSSNGDGIVVGGILQALAEGSPGERVVSPTQFHNSVHNAAAGYWSIAHGSRKPATCLGAHDWTWAASLLKAVLEVGATGDPVLLCCYDHPLPSPLDVLRPTGAAFGVGLVLAPDGDGPGLTVSLEAGAVSAGADADMPALAGNAAARALPLLRMLAQGGVGRQVLAYLDGHLMVSVSA